MVIPAKMQATLRIVLHRHHHHHHRRHFKCGWNNKVRSTTECNVRVSEVRIGAPEKSLNTLPENRERRC